MTEIGKQSVRQRNEKVPAGKIHIKHKPAIVLLTIQSKVKRRPKHTLTFIGLPSLILGYIQFNLLTPWLRNEQAFLSICVHVAVHLLGLCTPVHRIDLGEVTPQRFPGFHLDAAHHGDPCRRLLQRCVLHGLPGGLRGKRTNRLLANFSCDVIIIIKRHDSRSDSRVQ